LKTLRVVQFRFSVLVTLPNDCCPRVYWVQLLFNFTPVSVRQVYRPDLRRHIYNGHNRKNL